jgi:hypothetical protein
LLELGWLAEDFVPMNADNRPLSEVCVGIIPRRTEGELGIGVIPRHHVAGGHHDLVADQSPGT